MTWEMRHPQRESAQHCYTERDKTWLEEKGWVEVKRSVPVLLQAKPEVEHLKIVALLHLPKRKYTRKVKDEHNDIR